MLESTRLTTSLNRKWLVKMTIFLVALVVLGVWGTLDAVWIYPQRGRNHSEFALKDYLERLDQRGTLLSDASVEDPATVLRDLQRAPQPPKSIEEARFVWLESLSRFHSMESLTRKNAQAKAQIPSATSDTETMFASPRTVLDKLKTDLAGRNQPKPLSAFDIPLQYLFALLGFGGAAWMTVFLLRCKAKRFEFDPAENRLFLPDGKSFVPADITEVDKRDWHKFYLYMNIHGFEGEQKFDLLRHAPLEEWLETMRKLRPGYDPAEDATEEPSAESEAPAEAAAGPEASAGDPTKA